MPCSVGLVSSPTQPGVFWGSKQPLQPFSSQPVEAEALDGADAFDEAQRLEVEEMFCESSIFEGSTLKSSAWVMPII